MTLETTFLMLILIYLVMIAYGVVGGRRRGTSGRIRLVSGALMVIIPPLAILYALWSTGDAFLIAGWGVVALGMLAGGMIVAIVTEFVARRVGS